jgi:hypothetical protein
LRTHWTYDGTPLGDTNPLKESLTSVTSYTGSPPGHPGAAWTQPYGYDIRYRTIRVDTTLPAVAGTGIAGTDSTTTDHDDMDRPISVRSPRNLGRSP